MRDYLAWRKAFGVPTPSTNTVVQPEYDDMRPDGVTNHISRMMIADMPVTSDADFERLSETPGFRASANRYRTRYNELHHPRQLPNPGGEQRHVSGPSLSPSGCRRRCTASLLMVPCPPVLRPERPRYTDRPAPRPACRHAALRPHHSQTPKQPPSPTSSLAWRS